MDNAASNGGNNLDRVLASVHKSGASLDLKSTDLCFLIALYARGQRSALASFEEDLLVDVFERVCDLTEPGAENPRKRATHAIQRLRDQRLIARVDAAGVLQAGEFALTRLGAAIVEFFMAEETLTRESLTLLTKTLVSQLTDVLASAKKARDEATWRREIVDPLQVTVRDLVTGIERRQRGLDAQQEEIRDRIEGLLQEDWFQAVDDCELLLGETALTLRELNEVLLQDGSHLQALLQEIEELATRAKALEAEATAQKVGEHIEQVIAWGGSRLRAWSDYYQYVQRYLRDVVRLDPDRAVSQRLRDQLAGWIEAPFALVVADEPSIVQMRAPDGPIERPPVQQERSSRVLEFEEGPAHSALEDLPALVEGALDAGARNLSEVLAHVLPGLPESISYRAVGRVAELVSKARELHPVSVREWVLLPSRYEVEEWEFAREARHG